MIFSNFETETSNLVPGRSWSRSRYRSRWYRCSFMHGTYKPKRFVDFDADPHCTAIATKRNIACVVSLQYVYVIRLDRLVLENKSAAKEIHLKKEATTGGQKVRILEGKMTSQAIYFKLFAEIVIIILNT